MNPIWKRKKQITTKKDLLRSVHNLHGLVIILNNVAELPAASPLQNTCWRSRIGLAKREWASGGGGREAREE